MKKRIPMIRIGSILILILAFVPARADNAKTQNLEQKTYEISSLRLKIIDKIDQAVEMQARLEQQLIELRDEIRSEQIRAGIHSYPQAMQNLRIRYDLNLMQILQAYLEKLDERIVYFQHGNEHLTYLMDQIKDDVAILQVLKNLEIDLLTDRIDRVLTELIFETKKPVFDVNAIRRMPIQSIWEQSSYASLSP